MEEIVIPDEFYCSITCEIMVDPVVAEDGYSYGEWVYIAVVDKSVLTTVLCHDAIYPSINE